MYRTVSFAYRDDIDWIFDAEGNPVTPGGKELAASIAAALASGDSEVSDVEQHEYYGWSFTCRAGGDAFFQVVNAAGHEVYLTVQMEWYLVKRLLLRTPRRAFDRHCEKLGAALASISGVSNVHWDGCSS